IRLENTGQTLSSGTVLTSATVASSSVFAAGPAGVTTGSWWTVVAVVWAAGALVSLAGLLTGFVRLVRLTSPCSPAAAGWQELADELAAHCGIRRRVTLLQSDDPSVLVAFG